MGATLPPYFCSVSCLLRDPTSTLPPSTVHPTSNLPMHLPGVESVVWRRPPRRSDRRGSRHTAPFMPRTRPHSHQSYQRFRCVQPREISHLSRSYVSLYIYIYIRIYVLMLSNTPTPLASMHSTERIHIPEPLAEGLGHLDAVLHAVVHAVAEHVHTALHERRTNMGEANMRG